MAEKFFSSFGGITLKQAKEWSKKGYKTMEDVFHAVEKVSDETLARYTWQDMTSLKFNRKEVDLIKKEIKKTIPEDKFDIVGDYRLGLSKISELVIIVKKDKESGKSIEKHFPSLLPEDGVYTSSKHIYKGVLRLSEKYNGHNVTIYTVDEADYTQALLWFTGPEKFRTVLKDRAKKNKFKWSENGLLTYYEDVSTSNISEEDIFLLLGMKYLTPEERVKGYSRTNDGLEYGAELRKLSAELDERAYRMYGETRKEVYDRYAQFYRFWGEKAQWTEVKTAYYFDRLPDTKSVGKYGEDETEVLINIVQQLEQNNLRRPEYQPRHGDILYMENVYEDGVCLAYNEYDNTFVIRDGNIGPIPAEITRGIENPLDFYSDEGKITVPYLSIEIDIRERYTWKNIELVKWVHPPIKHLIDVSSDFIYMFDTIEIDVHDTETDIDYMDI